MENMTDRISWIRELVKSEEQMEEHGMIEMGVGVETERGLAMETLTYLQQLKNAFIETAQTFNELKGSALGRLKIYGIAKTQADFMLFRNGFKMIFSMKQPGTVSIRFNFIGPSNFIPSQIPNMMNSTAPLMNEILIEATPAAFGELVWSYQGQQAKIENVVKYHMSLFIKESAK